MDNALIKKWEASPDADRKIAAELASKIANGQLNRWAEFPDNRTTAKAHDVSTRTVIRAKALLRKHGAAKKVGGTYVVA